MVVVHLVDIVGPRQHGQSLYFGRAVTHRRPARVRVEYPLKMHEVLMDRSGMVRMLGKPEFKVILCDVIVTHAQRGGYRQAGGPETFEIRPCSNFGGQAVVSFHEEFKIRCGMYRTKLGGSANEGMVFLFHAPRGRQSVIL